MPAEEVLVFVHNKTEYKVFRKVDGQFIVWKKRKEREYKPIYKNNRSSPFSFKSAEEAKEFITQYYDKI